MIGSGQCLGEKSLAVRVGCLNMFSVTLSAMRYYYDIVTGLRVSPKGAYVRSHAC